MGQLAERSALPQPAVVPEPAATGLSGTFELRLKWEQKWESCWETRIEGVWMRVLRNTNIHEPHIESWWMQSNIQPLCYQLQTDRLEGAQMEAESALKAWLQRALAIMTLPA